MKTLCDYLNESIKAYQLDPRHPRIAGGNYMKAEKDGMIAIFLVYENPSTYGIDNGRISKLEIRDKNKNFLANYDRGWDIKPTNLNVEKFYNEIIKKYN